MREKEGCCWPHRACSPPHSARLSGASTLAISVYMRADQANSKPAVSPVQQVPHLPSCQVVQLGSEFLSLVPTVLPGAGPRHLTFTSRQHPASGSDPNLWHWSWDVTVWQVPTLCNEGGCNCPKSSSAVPGLGSRPWHGVLCRDTHSTPDTAAMACPAWGHSCHPSPCMSQECPGQLIPWSGSRASRYTSSLPCTP